MAIKKVLIQKDTDDKGIRLNKYISDTGICSRRAADGFIEAKKVTIDGRVAQKGERVLQGQTVLLNGKPLKKERDLVFIALNKPVGIVSTTDRREKDNIIDFVAHQKRIFPIGRLDKDSQGLIFLTNDGDVVNRILRAGNRHEKEYLVTVNKPLTEDFITKMSKGVPILGTITKKCKIQKESKFVFRIILTQGLNRQIRRMCEYFGYNVVKLDRVRIMNVHIGKLKAGQWRNLTPKEITSIYHSVAHSSKEDISIEKKS